MPVKLIAGRVHMEEYLRGWRDEEDVILPPLEKRGFLDNVIIREPVEPINKELSEKAVILDEKESENKTVLLSKPVIKTRASVQRVKTGEIMWMTGNELYLGKGDSVDFRILDNQTISRIHARIVRQGPDYYLEDLNSLNHTFVGGVQIEEPELLKSGNKFILAEKQTEEYYRNEVDILKKLRHSYLPQVLDFLELEDGIYIVMTFIPGKSFQQLMREGYTFTQDQLIRWGMQICNALDYLQNTFGRHGISLVDIEGMVINNYNANRSLFGSERSKLYQRKEEGKKYRMKQLFGV